ncbi:MAG TPA: ABC transporter permease, partial [Roseiflexaceae bacterium]|nr:ABC transporter permease [Roseiflexaceae bacterium]
MLREQFAMALDSLRANKVRSLLTMLGIIIGTGTLVAVLSLGNAVQGSVFEQFIDLGTRRIAITKGDPSARGARDVPGYGLLSISDAHVIEELAAQRADLFRTSTVEVIVPLDIRAGAVGLRDTVVGTGEQYTAIQSVQLAHGRFLTAADEARRAPVVVLGGLIARDLYGTDEARQAAAIGSTVEINGRPLEVIGILRAAGGPFSADRRALVPISTLRLRLVSNLDIPGRGMRVDTVLIGLQSEQQTEQASEAIRAALRNARGVPAEAIDD